MELNFLYSTRMEAEAIKLFANINYMTMRVAFLITKF